MSSAPERVVKEPKASQYGFGFRKVSSLRLVKALGYTLSCPWDSTSYAIKRVIADPEVNMERWIRSQNSLNGFIGLVGSVVSATVAQLLDSATLASSPWTAAAALFLALLFSIFAIVAGIQQTIFLESVQFRPATREKLKYILGVGESLGINGDKKLLTGKIWCRVLLLSLPQLLLTYSIYSLFVGLSLMVVSPLWRGGPDVTWQGPQKIATTYTVGIFVVIAAYFAGIVFQYTPQPSPDQATGSA